MTSPDDWPEPEPDVDDWPEPEPYVDTWPTPAVVSENILDQIAGTPGPLPCGCDARTTILTGSHQSGCAR